MRFFYLLDFLHRYYSITEIPSLNLVIVLHYYQRAIRRKIPREEFGKQLVAFAYQWMTKGKVRSLLTCKLETQRLQNAFHSGELLFGNAIP